MSSRHKAMQLRLAGDSDRERGSSTAAPTDEGNTVEGGSGGDSPESILLEPDSGTRPITGSAGNASKLGAENHRRVS